MPPKRKLDADAAPSTRPTRKVATQSTAPATKAAKAVKGKGSKAKKQALPSKEEFEKAALPLHVNIMHNPPPIDQVAAAEQAPGFMGHVVMTPSVFTTRSYGWKGSKKLLVELENSSGPEKTKVWVQLNINATVVGSKGLDDEDEEREKGEQEEDAAEASADDKE